MEETWKEIKGYPNYRISDLGNVKSINYKRTGKESLLCINKVAGYYLVNLYNNGVIKTFHVHKLVAIAFLNHVPCGHVLVINHKDFDKSNNKVSNLEIVTNRENLNKKHLKSTSKYTGVNKPKNNKKYVSQIRINGRLKYLGSYASEYDAHLAYEQALKNIPITSTTKK